MQCQIVKCTRTSLGPAWPGPKLVELPDDEARRLAAQGVVTIRGAGDSESDAGDTQEREQRPRHDRQMRRRQTR